MNLYFRLAWRNVWRHRRRTLIVVLAMGMGMGLMMFYDGIVAGFEQAIYANAVRVIGGNVQIHAAGYREEASKTPLLPLGNDQVILDAARAQPGVLAVSRRINTSGLASNREGAFPVSIIGIEPDAELPVSLIASNVTEGEYLAETDQDVALIGLGLAEAMGVKVGDRFTLVGRSTHEQTRKRTMTVGGIFDLGMPDIERQSLYISLAEARDLFDLRGEATEINISMEKLGQEPALIAALKSDLGNQYEIDSWETNYPELQEAIQTKGGVMDIFSVIILLIAGIGILNLLLMAIYERTREIGLLGALGMKPRQISILFLLEGALIGIMGVAFGLALGLSINAILGQVGLDYSQFTGMTDYTALISSRIYPSAGLENLAQRGITVLVVAILAAYYPAREASRREPAEALHFV